MEQETRKNGLRERLGRLNADYIHEVLSVEEALVYAQNGKPCAGNARGPFSAKTRSAGKQKYGELR